MNPKQYLEKIGKESLNNDSVAYLVIGDESYMGLRNRFSWRFRRLSDDSLKQMMGCSVNELLYTGLGSCIRSFFNKADQITLQERVSIARLLKVSTNSIKQY